MQLHRTASGGEGLRPVDREMGRRKVGGKRHGPLDASLPACLDGPPPSDLMVRQRRTMRDSLHILDTLLNLDGS
jgi:hypothetical protein